MSHNHTQYEDDATRFSFTLTLDAAALTDEMSNAIYALDIDDALIGESGGVVYIDFDIEGICYADAIFNMVEAVEKALPGVFVTGVHPPGEDAIEEANAFLKTRASKQRANWERLLKT